MIENKFLLVWYHKKLRYSGLGLRVAHFFKIKILVGTSDLILRTLKWKSAVHLQKLKSNWLFVVM